MEGSAAFLKKRSKKRLSVGVDALAVHSRQAAQRG
jgi:hypothetical protein